MKTYIHFTNNNTLDVNDKKLKENVRFAQSYVGLIYKDGTEFFYPLIHVKCIERKTKK